MYRDDTITFERAERRADIEAVTAPAIGRLPWIEVARGAPYFVTETGEPWTPIGQNDSISWIELKGLFRRRDLPAVEAPSALARRSRRHLPAADAGVRPGPPSLLRAALAGVPPKHGPALGRPLRSCASGTACACC